MAEYKLIVILLGLQTFQISQCFNLGTETETFLDCGGHLVAGEGYFESPGFPDYYPNDLDCTWTITTSPGYRVHIYSKYFMIENQEQCLWDYVEIIENGNDSSIPWKYCGNEVIDFKSISNSVSIYFHTDESTNGVGFKFKYTVIREVGTSPNYCNETMNQQGYLTSPNHPMKYPSNTNCHYNIQAPIGNTIYLKFNSFNVEVEPCLFDKVTVYEVTPIGKSNKMLLCGNTIPSPIYSKTNKMTLILNTDSSVQFSGFNISVIFIPPPTLIPSDTEQKQTTPISDTTMISDTTTHSIVQETPTTKTTETSTTMSTSTSALTITPNTSITSDINSSDNVITTSPVALYDTDCSYVVKNETGVISSPGHPGHYDRNKYCSILLKSNENGSIVIQFTNFDVEGSHECMYDYVVLIPDNDGSRRVLLCGRRLDKKIYTFAAETLQVLFRSDKSVHGLGYAANYFITPLDNDKSCALVCENGAECNKNFTADNILIWSCICPPNFYGELCEKKRTTCLDLHCLNNGMCIESEDNEVQCQCLHGFTGHFCEVEREDVFRLIKKPVNTTVARGSSVLLECGVNAPNVEIMWLLRDRILSVDDHTHGINIYPGGVLVIPDIKEEHEGRYTCAARSGDNWIEVSAWLSLVGPCHLRVTKAPKNVTRDDGDTALFECLVPDADSIVWHKDGDIVFPDNRKTILVNNYLMIENLMETDAGVYTCVAVGQNGCFAKPSAQLIIQTTGHNEFCGRPIVSASTDKKFRIASGREAVDGSAPWHVIIWESVHGLAYCGGSLVNEKWVLTAAHCVTQFEKYFEYKFDKSLIEMFIGTRHCKGLGGISRKIKDYIIYPTFNGTDFNNDLALFELDEPVTFGDLVMPICLEREAFTSELLKSGKAGIVTGCGNRYERGRPPTYLHEVTIPYVPRELCTESAKAVNASFSDYMICAGYARSMQGDACTGDSGGPYSMKFNGRWILVGIVSWGVGCDRENQYGYYTHISKYYDWIMSITTDNQRV